MRTLSVFAILGAGAALLTGCGMPAAGLGCSTISNMAAQIADPRDIMGQRPMDPADAGRRTVVIQNYRRGEPTGAQVPDDAAQLSDAIN